MSLDLDAPYDLDTPLFDLDGNRVAYRFEPPVMFDRGPVNPDTTGIQRRLAGYYQPYPSGANVWKLPDGSYSTDQPYPVIDPEFARNGNLPQGTAVEVTYLYVYLGGHVYTVDAAEAAALSAAGYVVS